MSTQPAAAAVAAGGGAGRRLDRRQLAALLRLTLGQALRAGRDTSTGTRSRPMLQVVLAMGFFGLVFTGNAGRSVDLASYLVLLFLCAAVLVTFAILPETQEARQRTADVLGCRPVPPEAYLVARAVNLGVIGGLIGGCFGLVALAGGAVRFGVTPALFALLLLSLLVQSLVLSTFWLTLLLFVLQRVSVARFRRVVQTSYLGILLGVGLASSGLLGQHRFALSAYPWLGWLPSTWFARLFLPGAEWPLVAGRVSALGLVGLAIAASVSRRLARRQAELQQSICEGTGSGVRRSATVWLLQRAGAVPPGRWLLPPPVLALVLAIVRSSEREEVSRLRSLGLLVLAFVFFGTGLLMGGPVPLALLSYALFANTLEALDVARQSSDAAASWLLCKAPLRGAQLLRALEAAVLLRASAVPLALLTVLLFLRLHAVPAAGLALCAALAAPATLALAVVVAPAPPLSREQRSTQSFLGLAIALVLNVGATVAGAVLMLLFDSLPAVAIVLGLLLLAALAVAAFAFHYWAARRLDGLEWAH